MLTAPPRHRAKRHHSAHAHTPGRDSVNSPWHSPRPAPEEPRINPDQLLAPDVPPPPRLLRGARRDRRQPLLVDDLDQTVPAFLSRHLDHAIELWIAGPPAKNGRPVRHPFSPAYLPQRRTVREMV